MLMDKYRRQQTFFSDISGGKAITALTTGTQTLATVPGSSPAGSQQLFVQRLHAELTAALANGTWSVQDSSGVVVATFPTSQTTPQTTENESYDIDLGPIGMPLTAGASLVLVISGGGAAGMVAWEGYAKVISPIDLGGFDVSRVVHS